MIRRRILLGALLGALFAVGWFAGRGRAAGDLYANLDLFVEVFQAVQANYVDPVESKTLMDGGLRGMLLGLDPYSRYLDAKGYASLRSSLAGSFEGIGATIDVRDGYPTIIAPIEGSPAWEAGLLPGDVLVRVDGKSGLGLTVEEAGEHLRGPAGTKVTVVVAREGESAERTFTLERRAISTKCVPYAFLAAPRIGYLRLASFGEKAGDEVRAVIDSLRGAGAHALVLDLRGNPGGLVEQAVDVSEQLVAPGSLIVYTRGRAAQQDRRYVAEKNRPELAWPVAVLVDGGSASASEIVAGALQDLDRALVIGTTSFGKGSVQNVYPLRGGAGALKLTTALYYTPSGRSIHHPHPGAEPLPDEADDEDAPPADTTDANKEKPRPAFKTASGRRVFGGGGISPDLVVEPDSGSALVRRLDSERVALRFANRWAARHADARPVPVSAEAWRAFVESVEADSVTSGTALERERPAVERLLRRELTRRLASPTEAARLSVTDDAVLRRALEVLARARAPRDVFSAAVPATVPAARGGRR